jgi:PAS domain S-box-containing protein
MKQHIRVLLIEDDEDDVLLAKEYLSDSENFKFELEWIAETDKAREKMMENGHDVILVDYRLGSETGLDLIRYAQENGVLTPCILLTGQGDLKVDIDASRYGAADYLVKTDLDASLLERSIRYALTQSQVIRELDEKEKKYRSLFERSIDPIFLANIDFKILDVNESFFNFFGYENKEGFSISLSEIFADEKDYDYLRAELKADDQVKDFEVVAVNNRGEKRICMINCVFIPDQSSDFCCYQGIIYDLTLRKKAEKDMLVAERLSMTGKLARTIAHEVRNPLTNLNLALEHLRDEMPKDNESVKLYSEIIERNAKRIDTLITEMLNSSKPKELNLELVDVTDILNETITLATDSINLNQVKLHKSYVKNLPRILVDREKLKIAFLNIIVNAIEAMERGKGELRVDVKLKESTIVVTISDNGKGIPAEDLEKLFDPFFTEKPGGMGLGLTSTKNIISSHNASIEVESTVKKGTSFIIYFKLAE